MNYLYGASGHGIVVHEIFKLNNIVINNFIDDNKNKKSFNELYVLNPSEVLSFNLFDNLFISIGNNKIRKNIAYKYSNFNFLNAIHPSSMLSNDMTIGSGVSIMAKSLISSKVFIGNHVIINSMSCIEHESYINDFVHISPGAIICGKVYIGEGTHIGAGATIIPNINIGKWSIIGAGAVITKDVPDYSLVVGVPGKIIKTLKDE
jgi:sugar O-acyltransferase (sialic acid O-acetyltransferase NeuD family)